MHFLQNGPIILFCCPSCEGRGGTGAPTWINPKIEDRVVSCKMSSCYGHGGPSLQLVVVEKSMVHPSQLLDLL